MDARTLGRTLRRRLRAVPEALRRPRLYPAGHFYSASPGPADWALERAAASRALDWIPLETQLRFVKRTAAAVADAFSAADGRYQPDNGVFGRSDALALYAILADRPPARIIEVGSGWSTAAALDALEQIGHSADIVCIEPYPKRLRSVLRAGDRLELIEAPLQAVDRNVFALLDAGDVLFIDSSHVAKAGSDVVQLVTEILPAVRPGVRVHFHDIFYPFRYPTDWLTHGREWNEAYMVHAFLVEREGWEVTAFNSMLAQEAPQQVAQLWPGWSAAKRPGSLWLTKLEAARP